MADGSVGFAARNAGAGPRLRTGIVVNLPAAGIWSGGLGNRPVVRRLRERSANPRCRCCRRVFPVHADARALPFGVDFFDAIICIDSIIYYGTDDLYLNYLARFVRPEGKVGIAGAGLVQEIHGPIPEHLRRWWTNDLWCLHSAAWWRRHWERTGIMAIEVADTLADGWRLWLDWHKVIAPDNEPEITALEADRGAYLGYVRLVGRRQGQAQLADHIVSIPAQYVRKPLLRAEES